MTTPTPFPELHSSHWNLGSYTKAANRVEVETEVEQNVEIRLEVDTKI